MESNLRNIQAQKNKLIELNERINDITNDRTNDGMNEWSLSINHSKWKWNYLKQFEKFSFTTIRRIAVNT